MSGQANDQKQVQTQGQKQGPAEASAAAMGIAGRALSLLDRQRTPAPSPSADLSDPRIEELRRQASEWIDRLLGLVSAGMAGGGLAAMADQASASLPATGLSPVAPPTSPGGVLGVPGVIRPGDSGGLVMRLANGSDMPARLALVSTDLVSELGDRIAPAAVSFWPENAVISPGGQAAVEVKVCVPKGTPAGRYNGLLQVMGQPNARTLLSFKVE